MRHIKDTIKNKEKQLNSSPVNSKDKSLSTVNSKTVTVSEEIDKFIEGLGVTPEGIAKKLAEDLDDLDSLDYYLLLAKNNQEGRLLEALSYVRDADKRGRIRTKKAVYFQGILRRWGIKTKFKGNSQENL